VAEQSGEYIKELSGQTLKRQEQPHENSGRRYNRTSTLRTDGSDRHYTRNRANSSKEEEFPRSSISPEKRIGEKKGWPSFPH
jgi:hypothetical protein